MKKLKGTKTAENLLKSFAGESQARNRYTYFSAVAEQEGYMQIKNIFVETANNEKEHAERFYNLLLDGFKEEKLPVKLNMAADYPIEQGTTLENLKFAVEGEHAENSLLYPEFAKIAEEEGFPEIATAFKHIAIAEVAHELRYRKLAENIENNRVFSREEVTSWRCENCGYIHEGKEAPKICPSCQKPQSYYELFVEAY